MNPYQEEKKKTEEWVSTLKVGDTVALRGGWNNSAWYTRKIVKITPTGRINLEDFKVAMPDGSIRGDRYNYIYPVTDDIKRTIWRRNIIVELHNRLKLEVLSDEHLLEVYKIYKEYKIGGVI